MSSPDLTPYIDLRLHDKDAQDIYEAAVTDLQTKLPEWIPREGNTEVMLLESMALEVSESIFAINRLPGSITTILLRLFGVTRDEGAPPTAVATFTLSDTLGHTIPAGTRVRLNLLSGLDPIVFTTDAVATVDPGASATAVNVTGDRNTIDANGTLDGTAVELMDAIAYVESVTISSVANGRDAETDDEWAARALQRFARLNDTLVVPGHFVAAALDYAAVKRAFAVDLYDPAVGPNPGDNPGHISIAVYGDGAVVDAQTKTDMDADFESRSYASLSTHIIDPTITPVAVTVSVHLLDNYVAAGVQTAIENAITQYLNPSTWSWSGTVRRNELIALVSNVEGVDYVDTLTDPAADVPLGGVAPLADAGTITVSVV